MTLADLRDAPGVGTPVDAFDAVDRSQRDSRFPQFFPSSELTASRYFPGTTPTFVHGSIDHRSS